MKPLKLFLFVVFLGLLGTIPSRAEKFSSSLHQDVSSSVSDQTVPISPQLPSQVSGTKMPPATSSSFPEAFPAAAITPQIPSTETNRPLPSGPDSMISPMPSQNPGFSNQATPTLKNPFEVKKPKISRPDFEAQFKKLQQQQTEEKTKKKKNLSESIRDELKNFGLFFLLGLTAILLVYALRKDAPASKPHVEPPKELSEKPRDIWKEDF